MRRKIKEQIENPRTKRVIIAVLALSLVLNLFLGYREFYDTGSRYPYLAKRLFAANQNDIVVNVQPLREKLMDYPQKNNVNLGLYFEYLPSGTSIGVNEKQVFFSASLIKIPLVMRTYRMINHGEIQRSLKVKIESKDIDKSFGKLWERGEGTEVTIDELVDEVLTESDNTAYNILARITKSHELVNGQRQLTADVYQYLDLPNDQAGGNYGTTPKNFSSILRSLYLSAYLPYEQSNEILDTMAQSTFHEWLPASVPGDIKVAHKFGLYNAEPAEFRVHSDCGIIYYPKRPYMLCVMVNTGDESVARKHIREISRLAYEFIDTANR